MKREELLIMIALKRKEMIDAALKLGLTHEKTIKYSQELDKWLNSLTKIKY